jgi:zinc finger protein
MRVPLDCPVCHGGGLDVTFHRLEIPSFGEIMESLLLCSRCGYRHSEVLSLEEREPASYTLEVERVEDLSIRVIRSETSTLRVPELDVEVRPGPRSEGYITNVEGVLRRIEDVLSTIEKQEGGRKKGRKAGELLRILRRVFRGEETVTLCLLDPKGIGAILSEKAEKGNIDDPL